jgi:hypothetical protein
MSTHEVMHKMVSYTIEHLELFKKEKCKEKNDKGTSESCGWWMFKFNVNGSSIPRDALAGWGVIGADDKEEVVAALWEWKVTSKMPSEPNSVRYLKLLGWCY